jgi:N utilization substance protein B
MLSRRHLRVKVLQSLYAFFQSGNDSLQSGEKLLINSIDKLNEQYFYILSFLVAVFEFAGERIEEGKKKYLPTEEDLNPNTKFIENAVCRQISSNSSFLKQEERLKINWIEETELIRKFYNDLKSQEKYKEYMSDGDYSYAIDKEFVIWLLKKQMADSDSLEQYFEDRNIFWASDYFIAIWLVIKTVKSMRPKNNDPQIFPSIRQSLFDNDNEDWDFMIKLFRKSIVKSSESETLIDERAKNWELDRIAAMDKLILKMAITELTEFKSIPVKVSLNEYIELAKIFSTAKSRVFINGILDKLIVDLQKNGKIVKTGRGLMS